MPRHIVERDFPRGLNLPKDTESAAVCGAVGGRDAEENLSWVHSYVSEDRSKSLCPYDGPSPEAIRKVAQRNDLPVELITHVSVLDPYFYS